MKLIVTKRAGFACVVSLLVMTMVLFTNVDTGTAGGNKGPLLQTAEKGDEAASKFDAAKWLELYKKNGWDKSKYVRPMLEVQGSPFGDWNPDLQALHQKMVDQSKDRKLGNFQRKILRPFRRATKVSELIQSGRIKDDRVAFAGTTTVLLNGSNPDTIMVGDSLEITIALIGDTAWVEIYYDANNDQMVDAGDFNIFERDDDNFIVDNGFEDEDPDTGMIKLTLYPFDDDENDFIIVSNAGFLFTADDGNAADTAAVWIDPNPTGYSVSGSVGGAYEGIIIFAQSCVNEFCPDSGDVAFALTVTDSAGDYTLDLPTSTFGYWLVGVFDVFGVTGGLFPSPQFQLVFVIGDEVGVDFEFIEGDATIVVTLEDDFGTPLSGVTIVVEAEDDFGSGIEDTTNASGVVTFDVIGGYWFVFPLAEDLLPNYLVPHEEDVLVDSGGVAVINLIAYGNDDSITGRVYLDDFPIGHMLVRGVSNLGYSLTYSEGVSAPEGEGYYSLPVSSEIDTTFGPSGYCVSVCHLSADQFTVFDHSEVPAGSDSIDIYIVTADGLIAGSVRDMVTGAPIEFAGVCVGDESDTTGVSFRCGGTDENGYYEMPVVNGNYFAAAFAEGYNVEFVDSIFINNDTALVDFYLDRFDTGEPGAIYGTVYDAFSGDPIPGAIVEVFSDFFFDEVGTDSAGNYWIDVPGGLFEMVASAIGYFPDWVDSILVDGNMVNVDFYLDESGGVCYPDVWSVMDVPNDQGREVLVTWPQACLDFADIEFYSLWRLPDEGGMGGAPTHMATIPEAGWRVYSKTAATLGDSIAPDDIWWSTYIVVAHTEFDDIFLQGFPNTGYSVDNLIPDAPSLSGSEGEGGVSLTWTEIVNEEAKYYTVYKRDVTAGGSFAALVNVTETAFVDFDVLIGNSYEYYVTATDFANNEGEISNSYTLMITSVDNLGNAIPDEFALGQNYPNPFNPTTSISYQLPVSGNVRLQVYNLNGELVNTLVHGEMSAGYHTVKWNGLTSAGKGIASGVYLYRIQANDFVQVRKMIMMK